MLPKFGMGICSPPFYVMQIDVPMVKKELLIGMIVGDVFGLVLVKYICIFLFISCKFCMMLDGI